MTAKQILNSMIAISILLVAPYIFDQHKVLTFATSALALVYLYCIITGKDA